jgi:predicted nucleic acid-binding protein
MILLDTNILGTFTLIGAMDTLLGLFRKDEVGVVPAVYAELLDGLREKRTFLQTAIDMVESKRLTLFTLSADEVVQRHHLPTSLDDGEAESITLCQARGAAFVTNDRRARNFCRSADIEVFDLVEVLRALWKLGVCSKQKVRKMLADIETKEGMVIKPKEAIFAK